MKKSVLLAAFLAAPLLCSSQEWLDPKVNGVNRQAPVADYFAYSSAEKALAGDKSADPRFMSIEGGWRFNFVKNYYDRPQGFEAADYDDSKWENFPVPGLFEMLGHGDRIYTNVTYPWNNEHPVNPPYIGERENYVGSYRQSFGIPSDWKGKRIYMHIGSATSNLRVWINGKYVGYSEDSKMEAEFDITDFVECGRDNLFAMQIMRWCDGSYIEDQDFWRFTGIARECYLYAREESQIRDFTVLTDLDAKYQNATLTVDASLVKSDGKLLAMKMTDADGRQVFENSVKVADGKARLVLPIKKPYKWTAETPYLYTLYLSLVNMDGTVIETIPQKVGFRKVEIRNRQLLVNGQPILIKGADRHEMDPDGGYVVPVSRMVEDIRIMKEMHINAVRTSHYPDDPRWYDLCDEYGIYLVAEANVEGHGMMYGNSQLAKNPDYEQAHLERNQANVITYRNHPSIIVWSMGNEDGDGQNFITCYDWIKSYDKTRPVQYEGMTNDREHCDIACPMYADYGAMERHEKGGRGGLDPRPFIECEYAHAMGNSEGGFKEYWDIIRANPSVQGGFIWDFVDQAVYGKNADGKTIFQYGGDEGRYPTSDQNFNCNGLIAPDRRWNPHAYEVAFQYQDVWITPLSIAKGQFEIYNEYFFRDLSNYSLHWQLTGNGSLLAQGDAKMPEVSAQQRKSVTISDLSKAIAKADKGLELLIGFEFRLIDSEPLLDSGFIIARNQIPVSDYMFPSVAPNATEGAVKMDEAVAWVSLEAGGVKVTFNKGTGWIDYIDIDGKQVTQSGYQLKSDFWRACTDNDFGASLQRNMAVWKNPQMRRPAFECKVDENGLGRVKARYDMESVSAVLELEYVLTQEGELHVTQTMTPKEGAQRVPDMFRFGMTMVMAAGYDDIEFYGRGPIENYSDRNSSQWLGVFSQKVSDQYFPYIRPQESGNKTDVRWWKVLDAQGRGLEFFSDAPLSMSSLNYLTEDIDESPAKHNLHSGDLTPRKFTVVHIDKAQYGLACVNSWGATPLDQYKLHFGEWTYSYVIRPVR